MSPALACPQSPARRRCVPKAGERCPFFFIVHAFFTAAPAWRPGHFCETRQVMSCPGGHLSWPGAQTEKSTEPFLYRELLNPLRRKDTCENRPASAELRPPITATPAWPRRRKRRVTLGHWPLEPVTQASAGRSLLVARWAASMSPESVPQGRRCMCFEAAQQCLLPCAPSAPHPDT
jgi:hypothetical protein